jgi:hypothetical protein
MKNLLLVILSSFIAILILTENISAQQTTTTTTTVTTKTQSIKLIRKTFPRYTVAVTGGAIFPLPKILNQTFKPGGNFGLDFGVRINKEVGIYVKSSYSFMSSKLSGAPVGSYFEFSGGPRYYFMNPKLKSQLFFEAGVGGYYFRQNSYIPPGDTTGTAVAQITNTKVGINGGIGATLYLSDAVDILVRGKYNVIFTPNGSTSFITVGAGFEFNIR